ASAGGLLASDRQTVNLDITLPGVSSLFGTIFRSDSVTPVSNPSVSLVNVDTFGPEGFFERRTSGDTFGNYQFGFAQAGTIQLSAADTSNPGSAGLVTVQLLANQPLNANVTLGNAFSFVPFFPAMNLDGQDGFRYDVRCDGELLDGGTVDRHL